jgi:hypothetical protein
MRSSTPSLVVAVLIDVPAFDVLEDKVRLAGVRHTRVDEAGDM